MHKDNKKIEEARHRREVLKSISRKARILRENRPEFEGCTINEILMGVLYNRNGNLKFKKFREWKQEGYTIKKGEKGYMLWAQPLSELKKQEGAAPETETEDEENSFFPVCYLFSNEQVIKPEPMERQPQWQRPAEAVPDLPL